MFNHAPEDYDCPFCRLIAGGEDHLTRQRDVVRRTDGALAFVASRWWPNNRGHALVVPTTHYHVHVFPRYDGDDLYATRHLARPATVEEREPYVRRLVNYFEERSVL